MHQNEYIRFGGRDKCPLHPPKATKTTFLRILEDLYTLLKKRVRPIISSKDLTRALNEIKAQVGVSQVLWFSKRKKNKSSITLDGGFSCVTTLKQNHHTQRYLLTH
jgi:hypothetical protein